MRTEISKIHQQLQTTFIYVTHDQMEAMTMATRIAVINRGKLQQLDTPQNLYNYPTNLFVAGFIGSPAMNFFPARLRKNGKIVADAGEFTVELPKSKEKAFDPYVGKDVIFGIRPEDVHDSDFVPSNIQKAEINAKVDVTELMGNEILLYLLAGKNTFVARVDPRSKLRVGDQSKVVFDMDKFHIFDAETEQAVQ
jgi:multiple sugar transport system ATP-binding protein